MYIRLRYLKFLLGMAIIILIHICCNFDAQTSKVQEAMTPFNEPPAWAKEAIWYQIFVERFRSGITGNMPTIEEVRAAVFDPVPDSWQPTPWTHNWYRQEDWALESGLHFYRTIQMRRYGGDLQGVLDQLDYLQKLGVNALYFNPINDAPSLHKFDARHYRHVDIHFGPDPKGDQAIIQREDPTDPSTWQWTSADRLFLHLVREVHLRGMHLILDFSWNHTGRQFWAWQDLEKNQRQSKFVNWYEIEVYDDPSTNQNEFKYKGWLNIGSLPELKKVNSSGKITGHPYEGNLHPEVKQHIFKVTRRWMDPNGDGDFTDGIDGMRLDVAEHVPMGFWRDYRKFVRSINPDFYLVGENWWTQWPDVLMDPVPWVKGDVFDAVMHYQWYKPARGYFNQSLDGLNMEQFKLAMDSVFKVHPQYTQQAMMNVAASHDSPRVATSFFNQNKYKYHCKPQEAPGYLTHRPHAEAWIRLRLFLLHQFTFIGSPHIWNGDEMGMWGADDPDNRKPLIWKDYDFDLETASDFSTYKYEVKPAFNDDHFHYYQSLIRLRKNYSALVHGNYEWVSLSNQQLLAYNRSTPEQSLLVILNNTPDPQPIVLPSGYDNGKIVFGEIQEGYLAPFKGVVIGKEAQKVD